jgi:predicted chitinase
MSNREENASYLIQQARAAGITDTRELAIFMGQMDVESGGFRSMHEGLNYRPERLLDVFGPYTDRRGVWHDGRNGLTTIDEARQIVARGPQGIAEAIYGGAWGARNLGNTEPGDGWRYHGRGYVQLTGRDNYERIGQALGIDLVNKPDLAADREIAARIAIHYWQERVRANGHQLDVNAATRDINGGQNHLAERRAAAQAWERKFDQGYLDRLPAPDANERTRTHETPVQTQRPDATAAHPGPTAIYDEAYRHFLADGNRFEYGRGDMQLRNNEGISNRTTDSSRTEQDNDRDGLKGVDCSALVWRGLKNAGYDVPARPFTTHALFSGRSVTAYAREHFEVIPADAAARDHGNLQRGDILLFKDKRSGGQHVGIFQGYDRQGDIQFIGSQVSTGPAQAEAGQGSYWNGGRFEIVGALRAKPEFQVRAPLHAGEAADRAQEPRIASAGRPQVPTAQVAADADGQLRLGEKGPVVATLQMRLADLGYRGHDGKPLAVDGDFGTNTRYALQQFQREHGLQGLGVAGPKTELALDRAERALMSHPSHPHHALYAQVLEKVHAEERARGIEPGHHSQRIAAALAVECLREGITRVDRVELSRDVTLVRGVQVSTVRDEPALNRATDAISTKQASQQPLAESSEQIHQVAVNLQAQQRDEQQRRSSPVLAN